MILGEATRRQMSVPKKLPIDTSDEVIRGALLKAEWTLAKLTDERFGIKKKMQGAINLITNRSMDAARASSSERALILEGLKVTRAQYARLVSILKIANKQIEAWSTFQAETKALLDAKEAESVVTDELEPDVGTLIDEDVAEELPIEPEQKDIMTWAKENVIYIILGVVILVLLLWRR